MSRLEKKCLMASGGLHAFLMLVVLFGSAFFTPKEPPPHVIHLLQVPPDVISAAEPGGGGNPNIPRSNDRLKGDTLAPVKPPEAAPQTPVKPPQTVEPPPKKAEPKKVEPKDVPPPKDTAKKIVEPDKLRIDLTELVPVNRKDSSKDKAKEEAEKAAAAKAAAEAKRRADAQLRARNQALTELQGTFKTAADGLKRGFRDGVAVDVGGPGGAAHADYKTTVQMIFYNAWIVTPELTDKPPDPALVRVTIARDGHIVSSRITKPSESALLNRSVQKAIDRVRSEGLPPFPAGITDREQSFTIEFNLKTRSDLG